LKWETQLIASFLNIDELSVSEDGTTQKVNWVIYADSFPFIAVSNTLFDVKCNNLDTKEFFNLPVPLPAHFAAIFFTLYPG
jgi:hypothetical protein